MNVKTPPSLPTGVNRLPAEPGGKARLSKQTGRDDSGLEQDAELFKQATSGIGDADPISSATGSERLSAPEGSALKQEADLFKHVMSGTRDAASASPAAGSEFLSTRADQGRQARSETSGTAPAEGDAVSLPEAPARDEKSAGSGMEKQQDLQDLVAAQMMRSQTAPPQSAGVGNTETISPQLVSDVAQRILVSAPGAGQGKEVRIQIKDTVLQDTEVTITRQKGELLVTFVTRSPTDNAVLARNRDAIATSLGQALDGPVKVSVDTDTEQRDRRSRGEYIEAEEI